MTAGAKDLLSLLSLLPDGLSNSELIQSALPVENALSCKTTLLKTSLAHVDQNGRLVALVPVREFMQQIHPPSQPLVHSLRKYFHQLLQLYIDYEEGFQTDAVVLRRITSNLGNLQNVLLLGLQPNNPDLRDTLLCAMSLNRFNRMTNRGYSALMDKIPIVASEIADEKVQALFITEQFYSWHISPIRDPETLISQARGHFSHVTMPLEEARFWYALALYRFDHDQNIPSALDLFQKSVALARSGGYIAQQCRSLNGIAWLQYQMSDYPKVRTLAQEGQIIAHSSGFLYQESRSLYLEAIACSAMGAYGRVASLCRRSRELLDLCGLADGEANIRLLNCEAEALFFKTEYTEAYAIQLQIVQRNSMAFTPVNYNHAIAQTNIALLDVVMESNKPKSAVRQDLEEARGVFSTMKWTPGVTLCDIVSAELEIRQGNAVGAKALLQRVFELSWGNDGEGVTNSLERLGDISRWGADSADTMSVWTIALLGHGLRSHSNPVIAKALCALGDMFIVQGDDETALSLFTVASEEFTKMDVHRGRGICMVRLGDISRRRGDTRRAVEFWKESRPLFERSSQGKEVASLDAKLVSAALVEADENEKRLAKLSELDAP
ncbi:hypothetical protein DFH07DRAFT_936614 [Mycena maculata]|uniref:Uncharacterized protein n=1 Tax=Mycena maculata TaxID=230809 RepID=A0AAD7K3I7_9AGAR|nr:hypothetical protein DFH07DRAFT_936614 [Mycena maculata]